MNCKRTELCRMLNHPSKERRRAYLSQNLVTASILYCMYPLNEQASSDPIRDLAAQIIEATDRISEQLGKMVVNPGLFEKEQAELVDLLVSIWKPGGFFGCSEAVETMHILAFDLLATLEDMPKEIVGPEFIALWKKLLDLLAALRDEFHEPARYASWEDEANGPLGRLREAIFRDGPKAARNPLRLFLANDRFWIAASSKNEVREILKRELGLINPDICGIQNSEVMENGMSAADMIALAEGQPGIVGRTE
ncbi:MAG: hypothetical protein K6F46_05845 [Desulfovibrio sp.]|nr:hypothetical protein [Desulfovibrio sp.]